MCWMAHLCFGLVGCKLGPSAPQLRYAAAAGLCHAFAPTLLVPALQVPAELQGVTGGAAAPMLAAA